MLSGHQPFNMANTPKTKVNTKIKQKLVTYANTQACSINRIHFNVQTATEYEHTIIVRTKTMSTVRTCFPWRTLHQLAHNSW